MEISRKLLTMTCQFNGKQIRITQDVFEGTTGLMGVCRGAVLDDDGNVIRSDDGWLNGETEDLSEDEERQLLTRLCGTEAIDAGFKKIVDTVDFDTDGG